MKSKILIILLIVSLGINLGLILTFVFRIRETKTSECGWYCPKLRQRFNLTADQIKILEEKRSTMQNKVVPIQEELKKIRQEMLTLHKNEKLDTVKLGSLVTEMSRLQHDIEKTVFLHMNDVKEILNNDQRAQFFEQIQKHLCPGYNFRKCERR